MSVVVNHGNPFRAIGRSLFSWPTPKKALGLGLGIISLCLLASLPPKSCAFYPWWIVIGMWALCSYIYIAYYFLEPKELRPKLHWLVRAILCGLDIALFLPASFLLYVGLVKLGIWPIPTWMEARSLEAPQMLVLEDQLYTIIAQEKQVTRPSLGLDRNFDNIKNTTLFHLRNLQKTSDIVASQISQIQELCDYIQNLAMPKSKEEQESAILNLNRLLQALDQDFEKASKKLQITWKIKKKFLGSMVEELQTWQPPNLQTVNSSSQLPVPALYDLGNRSIAIQWNDQNIAWQHTMDLAQLIQFHQCTLQISEKAYELIVFRYPLVGNTFIEEGIKQKARFMIQPLQGHPISIRTQVRSFFHRVSLLGTVRGVRHQDIFLRLVSAFAQTYCQVSVPLVLLLLLLLGSLPVLELLRGVPAWICESIKRGFVFLDATTAIPIYAVISMIFIGIYDGKNFLSLFLCVGYFILPSFYKAIQRQVTHYKTTYYLSRLSLGFSDTAILYRFIIRICRPMYWTYILYFFAVMILFETSFAYLKAGAASELSLGIFLYASRFKWTMETYSTMIVTIVIIYFFCRISTQISKMELT